MTGDQRRMVTYLVCLAALAFVLAVGIARGPR